MYDVRRVFEPLRGSTVVRKKLLATTMDYLERLQRMPDGPAVQLALSSAHFDAGKLHLDLGDALAARRSYEDSIAVLPGEPELATTRIALARALLGLSRACTRLRDLESVNANRARALRLAEQAHAAHPSNEHFGAILSIALIADGDRHVEDFRPEEAQPRFDRAARIREEHRRRNPEDPDVLNGLVQAWGRVAANHSLTGADELALKKYGEALELARRVIEIHLYGQILARLGQQRKARDRFAEAVAMVQPLHTGEPGLGELRRALAIYLESLAQSELRLEGEAKHAIEHGEAAIRHYEALVLANPDNERYQRDLMFGRFHLGHALSETSASLAKRDAEPVLQRSLTELREAERIGKHLLRKTPESLRAHSDLTGVLGRLGNSLLGLGRHEEAEAIFRDNVETLRWLVERSGADADHQNNLSVAINCHATSLAYLGRLDDARQKLAESRRVSGEFLDSHPTSVELRLQAIDADHLELQILGGQIEDSKSKEERGRLGKLRETTRLRCVGHLQYLHERGQLQERYQPLFDSLRAK
jgi:tetratricopeptide (TPR) repeat protein